MIGACNELGIIGLGDQKYMTRPGFRETFKTQLIQNGHDAVSVGMRSGHSQVDSEKAYHKIRSSLGKWQQHDLLPDVSWKMK